MKRILVLMFLTGVVWVICNAADLSGEWVIKQSKGIARVTPAEEGYAFTKENYYRGEKEIRNGVIRADGKNLSFQYSLSLTTSGTLENPDWIIENSIEDWVRIKGGDSDPVDLTGDWAFLDSVVTLRQNGSRLTGVEKKNGEVVAEFEGFADGRLISLKVVRQPKRVHPDFLELVVLNRKTMLFSWGFVEDTHWVRVP